MPQTPITIELNSNAAPIRIVQITDCHLHDIEHQLMLGMDTDESLEHVLRLIGQGTIPDIVLVTGDLTNQGSEIAYRRIHEKLEALNAPVFWLKGNHDELQPMLFVANKGLPLPKQILIGNWQLLLLDSTVPGEVSGRLGESELAFLRSGLDENPDLNTLVCLHHHPILIGCDWLDPQIISDSSTFLSIVESVTTVKAVLWGHIHQEFDLNRGHVRFLATPSTCIQFTPKQPAFKLDDKAPGYRWLELFPDGQIKTGVERVKDIVFSCDADSTGYL